jgi:tol-pal system protein YbgF
MDMTSLAIRSALSTTLVVVALTALPLQTVVAASTKERLDNVEHKLESNSRGLLNMLNRIEQMQRDIQQLRGEIELQAHTLEDVQRRSREQYMDIDRRLQQLESGNPVTAVPGASAAVAMATEPLDAAPMTRAPMTRPPGAAATLPPQAGEKEAYDNALAVLREGRYADAAQSFNRFLVDYPESSYADNTSYWLGETYYVTRDFDRSLATFKGLVEQYPNSPKAADSRLKIGYIYYEKKDWAAARQALNGVVADYPGSTAARLAGNRLKRMKKEGH